MIEIKLLTSGDSQYLANVAEDVFDDPIVESSAKEFLNDPWHRLVVGFVSAVIYLHPDKPSPELWVNEIGVAPAHLRQGLGKRLLQALLNDARQSGCAEAWVLTERENPAGMAMYKSAGGDENLPDPTMFTFRL